MTHRRASIVYYLRRLLRLAPALAPKLAWIVAVLLAIAASYVFQAILVARLVADILNGAQLASLLAPLGAITALVAMRAVLLAYRGRVALGASGAVTLALRQALAAKLFELGPAWVRTQRTGTLQSLFVDAVESAEPFVARFVPQCIVTGLLAAAMGAYVISLDSAVGCVVLACAIAAPLVPIASWRFIRERTERWQVQYRGLYAENLDAIQGMTTLKLLNASGRYRERLAARAREFCRSSTRVILIWGPYLGVVAFLVATGSAFAVGVGALHRAAGMLGPADLLTILLMTRECFRPVKDLENAYHECLGFQSSAKDLFEWLDATAPVRGGSARLERRPSLAFEDVTFWYEHRRQPALAEFTLEIAPGERVALVGRSGAGKTTVVSLLLRFFDPRLGRVRIAGRDIRDIELPTLRRLIAVVSQDTYLFHGSVAENLRIARPGASDAELEAAARAAQVHRFISALPDGYRTRIGERGLTLSGGERQRLSIARALLKDAPIMVLDEATSQLDGANEAEVQSALRRLCSGRLALVIAHRLSTVRDLDRLVLLERGRIVEQGSHATLLARGGHYARLAAAQGMRTPVPAVSTGVP